MPVADAVVEELQEARIDDPFRILGLHREGEELWVRVWQREATAVSLHSIDPDFACDLELRQRGDGLFEGLIAERRDAFRYEITVTRSYGVTERLRDPYSFWPLLSEWDLGRFHEGRHHDLEQVLGSRYLQVDGCWGVRFAVWAPTAGRVSVIGDWNGFDGRWHPMRLRHPFGVWELFVPGLEPGAKYKFEIRGRDGALRIKADPFARAVEHPPSTASMVAEDEVYAWQDADWVEQRTRVDASRRPLAIYEVHLGSWQRGADDRLLGYREMAPRLIEHCRNLGFTHVEFLPLAAHPYEGSWGYQVLGQFAADARWGNADDLRFLVDSLHQAGIGVIVDFVPGHFPKDDHGLARFDGHPLYEYADPKEGEHKTWGTLVFNWRRPEVRNFLIGAALFWIRHFHIDGLRVDAVSSMLYRNYDRRDGEWIPNEDGGRENWEAVRFLQELNHLVHELFPGCLTIAEESTAWEGVTRPSTENGLGFDLKWNMGWMHDSLRYFGLDPVHRAANHDVITFHQWYAYDERWVLPLSHDEVVHGKGSLLDRLWGDFDQRLAQLRMLLAWQITVPGRPLLFQGGEIGQGREWDWQRSVDWHEGEEPARKGACRFLTRLLSCYRQEVALSQHDDERDGFRWIDVENRQESLLAFVREAPQAAPILVVANFTPVDRTDYPVGVPVAGDWELLTNSALSDYGGPGSELAEGSVLASRDEELGSWPGVLRLAVRGLSLLLLRGPGPADVS